MRFAVLCLPAVVGLSIQLQLAHAQSVSTLDSAEVRRWNEDLDFLAREMPASHANLFHSMRRDHFDSALTSIRTRLPSLTRDQVVVELERLAAMIGDGHSNVSPWRDTVVAFHTLPVAFYRFAGGYYIRAASREQASLLGARVTRIGSVPIDSAEMLVARLIGRDNAMAIRLYAPLLLVMPEVLDAIGITRDPRRAELGLEINGKPRSVTLAEAGRFPNYSGDADKSWNARPGWVDLRDRSTAPLWLSRTGETYWFTYIPDGRMLYAQINQRSSAIRRLERWA